MSDKKFGVSSGGSSLIDHYEPHIVTAQDYYPFGMMSRVNLNGKSYTFGFNGKMNDNEVKGGLGNQQDYGMRIYDGRVGRFLSVDPLQKKYPELTPYQFSSNTPIQGTDLDGLEVLHYMVTFDKRGDATFKFIGIQEREPTFWQDVPFFGEDDFTKFSGDKIVGKSYRLLDKFGYSLYPQYPTISEAEFSGFVSRNFRLSPEQVADAEFKQFVGELALQYAFSKAQGMFTSGKIPQNIPSTAGSKSTTSPTANAVTEVHSGNINATLSGVNAKLGGRKLFVDENLSPSLIPALKAAGYNVKTYPKGTLDADILTYAERNNAIVLTNNIKDFNKWGITTIKVSENMKKLSEVGNVVKALDNISTKAQSNPSTLNKGKNVSLSENKQD